MNWSIYSSLPLLALAHENVDMAVAAYTEANGAPARAQLHPQNAKLAHVLEQVGIAVEFSGGVALWELRLVDGAQMPTLATPLHQDGASEPSGVPCYLFGSETVQNSGLSCQGRLQL